MHEETGGLHHAGVLVHDHQAAGAYNGPHLLQGVKVQGQVQVLLGEAAAGGAADLHGLELLAILDAAADVEGTFGSSAGANPRNEEIYLPEPLGSV